MNYIKNESGEIKVIDDKGTEKWIPEHIIKGVEGQHILRNQGLTVVQAPMCLPPVDEDEIPESPTDYNIATDEEAIEELSKAIEESPDSPADTIPLHEEETTTTEEKPKKSVKPKK